MKESLQTLVEGAENQLIGRSLVREYLQARILLSLQQAGASIPLAFHGGTALRFLYQLPRYSEDLDFALECRRELYDFRHYLTAIQQDLHTDHYSVMIKWNDQKIVHSALIRFLGLWYELGLSPHANEVLTIKLEIDTNPPSGARVINAQIERYFPLAWQYHDWGSLLAGKIHALLQRSYTKGRDWYDLVWYLTRPDPPQLNLTMLNHALAQSGWEGDSMTELNWREQIAKRCQQLEWKRVIADVEPFLIDEKELVLLQQERILELLQTPHSR